MAGVPVWTSRFKAFGADNRLSIPSESSRFPLHRGTAQAGLVAGPVRETVAGAVVGKARQVEDMIITAPPSDNPSGRGQAVLGNGGGNCESYEHERSEPSEIVLPFHGDGA